MNIEILRGWSGDERGNEILAIGMWLFGTAMHKYSEICVCCFIAGGVYSIAVELFDNYLEFFT